MTDKSPVKASTKRQHKYDAAHCVRIGIKLNVSTDAAILTKLSQVPSMSGYIRSLILDDIRRNDPALLDIKMYEKDGDSMSIGRSIPAASVTFSPDIEHNNI